MREVYKGSASHIEYVMLVDSSTGLGKTGLAYTDMTGSYVRAGAARSAITMATQTVTGAYSSGGFVEVDSTNQPGLYRFDVPDAVFATGVDNAVVSLVATGVKTEHKEFRLININKQVACLPDAAADAAGGLPISDAGGLDMDNRAMSAAAVTNANTVFDTDFASNYNTTVDAWNVSLLYWKGDSMANAVTGSAPCHVYTMADGVITAAKIAADAIDADAISADAVTEIQSGLATAANLATVAGYLDTEIAAILEDTGTTIPALIDALPNAAEIRTEIDSNSTQLAAIVADTNELQTDLANGGRIDLLIDAIKAVTDVIPDSGAMTSIATASALTTVDTVVDAVKVITDALGATAAARLALSAGQLIPGTVDTVTNSHTPTTTVFQSDDVTETTADHYNGRVIVFTSGALEGQATSISDYSNVGGIGQFEVVALTEAAQNNDTFIIV